MSGYNGWTNRDTWTVSLWLFNDEGLYSGLRSLRDRAAPEDQPDQLASLLREYVTGAVLESVSGLASDLLTSALEEVNWSEIAIAALED